MLAFNEWNHMIEVWVYLAGFAWFWRYHVGYVLDEFGYGGADGFDLVMSILVGTMATIIWPLTVAARGVYVLWSKYGADRSDAIGGFFPAPAEIESKQEKKERLEREKRRSLEARERDIRARERELGIGQ